MRAAGPQPAGGPPNDDRIDPTIRTEEEAILLADPDADAARSGPTVTEDGTIRAGKLAGKTMWAAIFTVSVPVLLQQFMQACVGLVDKLLAGNLPKPIVVDALDGIGIGTFVGWFIMIAMTGLGVGGQAIIARSMGSGDRHEASRALGQSVTLSLVWGTVVGIIMWFSAAPLASIAGLSPGATHWCEVYVRAISLGMPFCGLMSVGTMCLHGAGEATKPLYIAVLVNVVNTVGAWIIAGVDLRFGSRILHNPMPHDPEVWGVFGIGAGAAICYLVGGLATLAVLVRGVKDLRLEWWSLRPDAAMSWRIIRVGIPNFLEGLAMWAVQLFVMHFIGLTATSTRPDGTLAPAPVGAAAAGAATSIAEGSALDPAQGGAKSGLVGAHTIAVQWESFSFLPGFAMGTAAGAVAGQYLGAGNARLARKAIWACTFVGMGIMGSLGIVFMTCGTFLTSLISNEPIHLELVPKCLFTCGIVQLFFALAMVVRNGLRGVGDTMWLLGITMFSCYLIRLPLAYYFGVHLGLGLPGIWIGLCSELVTRGLFFLARFVWGDWAKVRV